MINYLHGDVINLTFARFVIHNAASNGSKFVSPWTARLASPRHECSGSVLVFYHQGVRYQDIGFRFYQIRQDGDVECAREGTFDSALRKYSPGHSESVFIKRY